MELHQILYSSLAKRAYTDQELREMAQDFAARNRQLEITGLLTMERRAFVQVIEGPKEAVLGLYAGIRRDPRHDHVLTLIEHPVAEREFPDWSMEYSAPEAAPADPAAGKRDAAPASDLQLAHGLLIALRNELRRTSIQRA